MKKTSKTSVATVSASVVEETKPEPAPEPAIGPEAMDSLRLAAVVIASVGKRLRGTFDAPACAMLPRWPATVERGYGGLIDIQVEFQHITIKASLECDPWRNSGPNVSAKADVNWSAIGGVSATEALAFGALLSELTTRAAVAEATLAAEAKNITGHLLPAAEAEAKRLGTYGGRGFTAVYLRTLADAVQEALNA